MRTGQLPALLGSCLVSPDALVAEAVAATKGVDASQAVSKVVVSETGTVEEEEGIAAAPRSKDAGASVTGVEVEAA